MKNYPLSSWKKAFPAGSRSWLVVPAFCLGMVLLHGRAAAQSTNNLSVRTYDTVLTGPGWGTYHITVPKWRTDSGLLVSVKISTVTNLQYGYTLKNTDVITGTYGLVVGREDYFTSPALSAAYDNINERNIGSYTLNAGDQVSVAPFAFLSNYANVDSIYSNTAPFLGTGTLSFTYMPITYTNLRATNNASYGYHATATETTHFTVSYLYSNGNGVLATDLTNFTASLTAPGVVRLNWSTAIEQRDRTYEIQRSGDGQAFTTIGYQTAEAVTGGVSYSYTDKPSSEAGPGAAGGSLADARAGSKWYYRLRLVSPGGISYSSIQSVKLPAVQAGLLLYPNPTVDHINLRIPGDPSTPGDWLVNIRAADGRLVQSATFLHSNNLPIFFHQRLAAGVYFVRITDLQGRNAQVTSFRVDHL